MGLLRTEGKKTVRRTGTSRKEGKKNEVSGENSTICILWYYHPLGAPLNGNHSELAQALLAMQVNKGVVGDSRGGGPNVEKREAKKGKCCKHGRLGANSWGFRPKKEAFARSDSSLSAKGASRVRARKKGDCANQGGRGHDSNFNAYQSQKNDHKKMTDSRSLSRGDAREAG